MTKNEKEIITLIKEWKDEIVLLTSGYNTAVLKLNEISEIFKKKTLKDVFLDLLPSIIPQLLTLVILITFIVYVGKYLDCNVKISVFGAEISRDCAQSK